MRFAVFLGVLSVGVASLWLVKDRSATSLLRDELLAYRLDDLVGFQSLRLADLDRIEVTGGELSDPVTGRLVAHVNLVTITLTSDWIEGEVPEIRSIAGHGGRVLVDWEQDELLLARAIAGLITAITEALPADRDPDARMPELTFDDLEVVVHGEGWPLERFERVACTITQRGDAVDVEILTGSQRGRVLLTFDDTGLSRVLVDDLRFRPVLAQFDPTLGDFIGRTLGARGLLDLDIRLADGHGRVEHGSLREAYLDTTVVPFPLGPATIPFRYVDDKLDIDNAVVGFQGGSVVVSAFGPLDAFTMTLDVERARFREEFIKLIPAYRELDVISCEDGGNYELHLSLPIVNGEIGQPVVGRGGFLIDALRIDPPGFDIEQVVGQFEINGSQLSYPEVSGRCADGGVIASGEVDMDTGDFKLNMRVEDVDISQVHAGLRRALHAKRAAQHSIAGWLQGEVECSGSFADLGRSLTGFGQLSVRAGDLWDTPLIENILLALPQTDEPRGRHRVEAEFNMHGGQIFVDPIRIESDLFTLRGGGSIDSSGRLDLELVPIAVPLGWFGRIVETIQQRFFINLVVSGTVDDPRVQARPMDVVTGPVSRAFSYLLGDDEDDAPGDSP